MHVLRAPCPVLAVLQVWNSDTSEEARKGIQADLVSDEPEMRLLYTTPESLRHPSLRGYLKVCARSQHTLAAVLPHAGHAAAGC